MQQVVHGVRRLYGWAALVLLFALPLSALNVMLPGAAWAEGQAEVAPLDYAAWDKVASGAETDLGDTAVSDQRLDQLRSALAEWRASFTTAQNQNASRIATLRDQIAALGPAPEGDATEAADIATKRKELNGQLTLAQAPAIAAEEAYRRADGLIREIDAVARERQTDQLLQLWPSPVNPANWPEAATGVSDTVVRIWGEVSSGWSNDRARTHFFDSLPLILLLLAVFIATTVFARPWIEAFAERLRIGKTEARRRIFGLIASLGQVVVPSIGIIALSVALDRTGFLGTITGGVASALPWLGGLLFIAFWLGARSFPRNRPDDDLLALTPGQRAEARVLSALMGVVLLINALRMLTMAGQNYADAVTSVVSFPIVLAASVLLYRMGRIMRLSSEIGGKSISYGAKLLGFLGYALKGVGLAAPVLAVFGYVSAGSALAFSSILSLGLLGFLIILQRFLSDLWAVIYPAADAEAENERLVPVLLGFGLALLSLPLFALIWGSRLADLSELWTRFREGFQLGATRVSPTDFLLFAVIFVLGYLVTRVFQGALRNSILPRTRMDRGGQNALVSGTGYIGIFLSALVAINATGIDLSGLAIVASALTVGIGFGLQNIVQNFVSGIILMIERPVSEGDWIEVGTTQGVVKTISVRSTRIQTFDRNVVVVPNADLVSQRVTNWTRFGLAGRLIVPVSVAWGEDNRRVEKILREIAEAQPMVILNPPPTVVLQGFAGGVLNFEIRVILRDVNASGAVRSDINHMIAERFIAEQVAMPQTSAVITLGNAGELGEALRPVATAAPDESQGQAVGPGQPR
ncbi:mechanosensitive ion channel family protein [Xinfangfangia sp. D13-10-4-6]|uniref:DUF3772 domain-containing protein n=1 Tax=Pseudogemmobacter hezensis TaxID=2737662 RepID=UPI001553D790|nr:DUF3772 domain-containing protein [Pseudogemmobacter hezensis]NPD16181.1 mechanosensitive ion channel family protein [Pseudogemmobacter hezensis]